MNEEKEIERKIQSLRNSSCTGKARHESFSAASVQLKRSKQHRNGAISNQSKMSIYHCVFCNGYHIGHKTKKGSSNL